MRQPNQISIAWYVLLDYIMAALAWSAFYFTRKIILNQTIADAGQLQVNNMYWLGVVFIPAGWIMLYALVGSYHSLYRKSRLSEFTLTFICTLVGCTFLFFAFILDDVKDNYSYYYLAFACLFLIHLVFIFTGRVILLNRVKHQLLSGKVFFNTLMIGGKA